MNASVPGKAFRTNDVCATICHSVAHNLLRLVEKDQTVHPLTWIDKTLAFDIRFPQIPQRSLDTFPSRAFHEPSYSTPFAKCITYRCLLYMCDLLIS